MSIQDISLLTSAQTDIRIDGYIVASILSWVVYDTLLTLGHEISTLWNARRSPAKALYFLTRYATIVSLALILYGLVKWDPPSSFCTAWRWGLGFFPVLSYCSADALMILRIYVLYSDNKKVLASCVFLYAIDAAYGFAAVVLAYGHHQGENAAPTYIPACLATSTVKSADSWAVSAIVAHVCIQCTYVLLILWKFLSSARQKDTSSGTRGHSSLFQVFIKDGVTYFVVIAGCSIITMVILILVMYSHKVFSYITSPLIMSGYAIAASRLILSLRTSYISRPEQEEYEDIELNDRAHTITPPRLSHTAV